MNTGRSSSRRSLDPYIHQQIGRIFHESEDIVYVAMVNKRQEIISQHGFLDIEPSKLQILHIQASVMVDVSSAWVEAFGKMNFLCASFDSKTDVIVTHINRKMYLMVVRSTVHKKGEKDVAIESLLKDLRSAISCPPPPHSPLSRSHLTNTSYQAKS